MYRVLRGCPFQITKYQEQMKKTQEGRSWCQAVFQRLIACRYRAIINEENDSEKGDGKLKCEDAGRPFEKDEDEWVAAGLTDHMILDFCSKKRDESIDDARMHIFQ